MHNAFPKEEDEWKRQDVRFLGGLGKYMPVTKWAMLIAGLSLAGFPLISGFWSKDEVLATVDLGDSGAHRAPDDRCARRDTRRSIGGRRQSRRG